MARTATAMVALLAGASAFTKNQVSMVKQPHAKYSFWLIDQVAGDYVSQVSGGGTYSDTKVVTDAFAVNAGCYAVETPKVSADMDFTMSITSEQFANPLSIASDDRVTFALGGAFCDLPDDYNDCLSKRSGAKPQVTCRNLAITLTTDCKVPAATVLTSSLYTKADDMYKCDESLLHEESLFIVLKPAPDCSGDIDCKTAIIKQLASILDLYTDAFTKVILHEYDGFSVLEVQFMTYGSEELAAVKQLLNSDALSPLLSIPGFGDSKIIEVGYADGYDVDYPQNVQDKVDVLNNVCADGSAPGADNKCDDGSKPEEPTPTPEIVLTPKPTRAPVSTTPKPSSLRSSTPKPTSKGDAPQCKEGDADCETNNASTGSGSSSGGSSGLSGGAIAGICVGCLVGAAAGAGGMAAYKKRAARKAAAAKGAAAHPAGSS